MSTILNEQLVTTLEQPIAYLSGERAHIAAFYPYLLLFNSPAGTFTFSLLSGATVLFSQEFTSASIKAAVSTTNDYVHTFHPIVPTDLIQLESGDYIVKISATGYTATDSSYLAWIQQHEDLSLDLDYTPGNDTYNPFSMRIKTYK